MFKIEGPVNKLDTLSQCEGLPVYYNHHYLYPPLGVVKDGQIIIEELKSPFEKFIDLVREGKVYAVTGQYVYEGHTKITEVSLTLFPLPEYKGEPVRLVEEE